MKCKNNCGRNTQYGNEYCEQCMDEMIKQEVEAQKGKVQTRKNTLMDFYYRMKKQLEDNDFDFILFCQCYATLTEKEGFDLSNIYLTDFNNALIKYRNSKPTFRIDREKRLEEELGWQEVKIA